MKITDNTQYKQAIERANALRSAGASADDNRELADLLAAITRYEVADGGPGESKGRPKSWPKSRPKS